MSPDLTGWMPVRISAARTQSPVDWCWFGDERLTQPFFEQTVAWRMRRPFCRLFRHQTSMESLAALRATRPGLKPAGFIFHVSRCGSTLASQVLASSPRHRVVSEAASIDGVLRWNGPGTTDERRATWLEGMIHALGEPLAGEKQYFIKFDSWHVLQFSLVRRVFPEVPCVFIYRDPIEVLVSHERQPGSQMIPGALGPLVDCGARGDDFSFDEYKVGVLATFFEALLQHRNSGRVLLVDYNEFPAAVLSAIPKVFGVDWSDEELQAAEAATRANAKNPAIRFESDTAAKQSEAADTLRELSGRRLRPLYEHLR